MSDEDPVPTSFHIGLVPNTNIWRHKTPPPSRPRGLVHNALQPLHHQVSVCLLGHAVGMEEGGGGVTHTHTLLSPGLNSPCVSQEGKNIDL